MTDKRKNNGGHSNAGRKSLGADKMRQFSVTLNPAHAVWFKANGVKALRELIEKAMVRQARQEKRGNSCVYLESNK